MNNKPKGPMGKGMAPAEKPKNFFASIKKLIKYNKPFYSTIIVAIVLSMLSSVLAITGPDILKNITNVITEGLVTHIDVNKIKDFAVILITIYIFNFIFNYSQGIIMATVTNKFSKKMRKEISEKINKLPLSYFDKTKTGDILSRVTNDVDTISQTMNQSTETLVRAITMFIGAIFMMFITNWILALTAVFSSIIGFAFMGAILKKSQKYFISVQEGLGNLNGHIEEIFTGLYIVKIYNGTTEVNTKFNEINNKLCKDNNKSQFYSGLMMPLMGFIGNFGYVAICIVGAILALNNYISFGVIVAFMIYVRLFTQQLNQLGQAMNQLQSTAAAGERVFEFLEEEEMPDESHKKTYLKASEVKGNIRFNNINFGYSSDKLIIKNFNAIAKKGQKIAIVGPTGAGKTTIVNLLMKFYDVNDGDILIDNISIKELSRENIHKLFVMVLQDTWLFDGSIKENIRYNQKNVSDERIIEVCKTVGLHHFIQTLPEGYNTVLKETDSLSSGQKQLLTIARSMIEDAPFLILDEATSSVDTRTEILVQEAMDKLTKGRTSFIIAHRLSTIKNANLILVMNEGNIIEQGTHDELLLKNGFYADLYNSQFQNAM